MRHRFWHGLCAALAVGFATKLFGLIGGGGVAAVMAILWRWPKPQIITAGVMMFGCFVGIVLLQDQPPREPAWVAQAKWASTPVASTQRAMDDPSLRDQPAPADVHATQAQWTADVDAFVIAHPDIRHGSNPQIWAWYTQQLADKYGVWTNVDILSAAYVNATSDVRWQHD